MVSCSMLLFSATFWAEKSIMGWQWSFVNQEFTSLLKTWTVSLCWHVHIDLRLNVRLAISQWLTQGGHAVPPCLLTKSSIKSVMFPIHWSVAPCHTSIVCFFFLPFQMGKMFIRCTAVCGALTPRSSPIPQPLALSLSISHKLKLDDSRSVNPSHTIKSIGRLWIIKIYKVFDIPLTSFAGSVCARTQLTGQL